MQIVEQKGIPLTEMGQMLRILVQAVVDLPAQVRVRETVWGSRRLFEVRVAPTDTGKALGKQGDVLNSIRTLMAAMSSSHEHLHEIHLVHPSSSRKTIELDALGTPSLKPPVLEPPVLEPLVLEPPVLEPSVLEPLDLEQTRQLLERIIRKVVDKPERASVTLTPCNHLSVLEIEVNPTNFRQVLGRRGRTIDALRQLLRAMGGKLHRPMHLHLIERFQTTSETTQEASP